MKKLILTISAAFNLFKVRFLKKRVPLVIGWALTKRCNYRCKYCRIWRTSVGELSTKEICIIINEMADMGLKKVSFTGGEPLLRDDIGKIIDYACGKNVSVAINSNGSLIKEKLLEIKKISSLGLSLEGPEEIHDSLRQNGSFQCILEAARLATANNINVTFNTTLNTYNFDHIDFLLRLAERYNAQIIFQPSTYKVLEGTEDNPVSLSPEKYSQAMKMILERKKYRYRKIIRNSIAGLVHLSQWPNLKMIRCASGLISCRIEPDGGIFHCARMKDKMTTPLNCKEMGFKNAFYGLRPILCNDCSCALRVEASYILKLDISALINAYLCERMS